MDLEKIGRFIAECRKKKNLTQLQLADLLFVSDRAVSKWENGKSCPDSSIMLELCKCLDITVIDLLNGEIVGMENYKKETEESLLRMVKEKEESDKRLLRIEVIFGIMISILCIGVMMFGTLYPGFEEWLRIVLCVTSVVVIFAFCFVGIRIEQKAGYYVCPNCGHRYVPAYKSVLFATHVNRTRYMKCPNCGKKGWHKKSVSKEK